MLGGLEGGVEGKGEGGVNWVVSVGGVSDLKAVVVLSVTVGVVSVVVKVVVELSVTEGGVMKVVVIILLVIGG